MNQLCKACSRARDADLTADSVTGAAASGGMPATRAAAASSATAAGGATDANAAMASGTTAADEVAVLRTEIASLARTVDENTAALATERETSRAQATRLNAEIERLNEEVSTLRLHLGWYDQNWNASTGWRA